MDGGILVGLEEVWLALRWFWPRSKEVPDRDNLARSPAVRAGLLSAVHCPVPAVGMVDVAALKSRRSLSFLQILKAEAARELVTRVRVWNSFWRWEYLIRPRPRRFGRRVWCCILPSLGLRFGIVHRDRLILNFLEARPLLAALHP